MSQSTAVLLAIIGALLTVIGTVLLFILSGIREDLKHVLQTIAAHQDDIKEIKTVLKLNGCMDADPRCRT